MSDQPTEKVPTPEFKIPKLPSIMITSDSKDEKSPNDEEKKKVHFGSEGTEEEMKSARKPLKTTRSVYLRRTQSSFDIPRIDITNYIPEHVSQKLIKNEINIMELPERLIPGMAKKEESVNFSTKGREIINTSFILLILLIIRIAPMLVNSENPFEVYSDTLQKILTIDSKNVKFFISFPSTLASTVTFAACAIFGFINVFVTLPGLKEVTNENVAGVNLLRLIGRQITHPFFPFVGIMVVLSFSHLCFIFGLFNQSLSLIVFSRIIFGCADTAHYFLFIYFIVKHFKNDHFSLSIGFIISLDAFVSVLQTFVHEIMNLYTFLWTVFGLLIFSFGATLSLPYLDMSNESEFLHRDIEVPKDTSEKEKKQKVDIMWGVVIFFAIHSSLTVAKFLAIDMFPFRFGGVIWNEKYVPLTDKVSLNQLREGIFFTRAILSPGIGALLDSEHGKKINAKWKDGWIKISYEIITHLQFHLFALLFGFGCSVICNFLLLYGGILPKTVFYHTLSAFYGFSQSLLINAIFSTPWILIRNLKFSLHSHTYSAYYMLISFFASSSDLLSVYLIQSEAWLLPVWYVIIAYVVILFVASIVFIIYIHSNYKKAVENLPATIVYGTTAKEKEEKDKDFKEATDGDETEKPSKKYLWLLLYFPLDFIVFIFCLLLMLVASGCVNIILYFTIGTRAHLSAVKIFFLPVVSILCVISMKIAFPEVTDEFFGSMFFKRTRSILGFEKSSTIGAKLQNNCDFSIATAVLEKKRDVWRYLNSNTIEKKPTIVVYKDIVVLHKEEERVKILEDTSNIVETDYDKEECSNGTILVPKFSKEKTIYDYNEQYPKEYVVKRWHGAFDFKYFTDNFYLGVYTGYCLFFTIPIFYRVLLKIFCTTCGEVLLFDDNIAALVIVINFVFGFFILIPFIGLWQEISRILENLAEHSFIFRAYTQQTFKPPGGFKNVTYEMVKNWSIIFTHLNAYILAKASFVKYIFILSYGTSKVISILFSLVALFVRVALSQEILQLIYVVLLFEFAVLRYIITPASVSTNEIRLTIKDAHLLFTHFNDFVNNDKDLTKEEREKLRITAHYFRDTTKAWEGQTQLGFVGFQFRINEIGTAFPITADFMRNALYSTFITIIPAVLTYFVKLFA